jgi:hypothetical protein
MLTVYKHDGTSWLQELHSMPCLLQMTGTISSPAQEEKTLFETLFCRVGGEGDCIHYSRPFRKEF